LTEALRNGGALDDRAEVIAFDARELGPDKGFVAQIAQIRLFYDRAEASAPRSVIAKFSAADAGQRAHGLRQGLYEREVRFYQELAGLVILSTPRCYHSDIDLETGAHILILEDLGPADGDARQRGCTGEEASLVVREMARFHAGWWQRPELGRLPWIPNLDQMHDFAAMQKGFTGTIDRVRRTTTSRLPPGLLRLAERASPRLRALANALYFEAPQTLVHFDLQRDNLYFRRSRNDLGVTVIDWQLMTRGNGTIDMAQFLGENLDSTISSYQVKTLLATYHNGLLANGIDDYPFETCLADFRSALLLRMLLIIYLVTHLPFSAEQRALHMDTLLPRVYNAIGIFDAAALLERQSNQ